MLLLRLLGDGVVAAAVAALAVVPTRTARGLLVGIDLLIAWNTYQRFFVLLGIELIIAAAAWLFIMIYSIGSSRKSSPENKDGVR